MFDLKGGWNLSFAGCGFLGIYHVGVASCLQERAPHLLSHATNICGASAGALTAAVLASQASIAQCCEGVIEMAMEARGRSLGPLHPSFNLVKVLRTRLARVLPANAHALVSGQLRVSLTRVSDGENVIVSQFNSREELIQALICSCFIPVYCGLIPPSFQGVRYVDGALSDNMPQSELRNTVTISPFSGESDICPRDPSSSALHELRVTNTSIQMNLGNMYRVSRALFPPEPKVMAEMCQNGYKDALRFLQENNLLTLESPTAGPAPAEEAPPPSCCCPRPVAMETSRDWLLRRLRLLRKRHYWLDERMVHTLPTPIRRVLCEACKGKPGLVAKVTELLPVRVASFMMLPCTLPLASACSAAQRFVEWIPEVPADVRWLCGVAGDVYRGVWRVGATTAPRRAVPLRKCMSLPLPLDRHLAPPTLDRDRPLALSTLDLHSHYWDLPTNTSTTTTTPSPLRPPTPPPSPQVCFFVASPEETDTLTDQ